MKDKYVLTEWPESQEFIGHSDCYLATSLDCNEKQLDQAYFVPEDLIIELKSQNKSVRLTSSNIVFTSVFSLKLPTMIPIYCTPFFAGCKEKICKKFAFFQKRISEAHSFVIGKKSFKKVGKQ